MNRHILFIFSLFTTGHLFSQNAGDLFFHAPAVHEIRLTFHQSSYWDSLEQGYINDAYIKGDVEIDGILLTDCGIKFKGNSSYNNPSDKKSFKLDLNEFVAGQEYDDLKKLNLNNAFKDPSFLREKLMLEFLLWKGVKAPRCAYTTVYINGTLWGLYNAVEQVNNKYLNVNFGDNSGNLFKGDPTGDLRFISSNPADYYAKYELKTNETVNDWTDLVTFIDKLNNTPLSSLEDTVRHYLDLDEYIKCWAVHLLFSNLDSYLGSGHNYYLYHDMLQEKFRFINWDVNEAFGNFKQGLTIDQIENLDMLYVPGPPGSRPLHERLLQLPAVKQQLADELCEMIHFDFSIWGMEAKIDSLANAIRPYVYADPLKFYTNQNFEDNISSDVIVPFGMGSDTIPGIKSFLINRRINIASQVAPYGCVVGVEDIMDNFEPRIYPQPATGFLTVQLDDNKAWEVTIFGIDGKKYHSWQLESSQQIDISELPQGIYLMHFTNRETNTIRVKKFIKT